MKAGHHAQPEPEVQSPVLDEPRQCAGVESPIQVHEETVPEAISTEQSGEEPIAFKESMESRAANANARVVVSSDEEEQGIEVSIPTTRGQLKKKRKLIDYSNSEPEGDQTMPINSVPHSSAQIAKRPRRKMTERRVRVLSPDSPSSSSSSASESAASLPTVGHSLEKVAVGEPVREEPAIVASSPDPSLDDSQPLAHPSDEEKGITRRRFTEEEVRNNDDPFDKRLAAAWDREEKVERIRALREAGGFPDKESVISHSNGPDIIFRFKGSASDDNEGNADPRIIRIP